MASAQDQRGEGSGLYLFALAALLFLAFSAMAHEGERLWLPAFLDQQAFAPPLPLAAPSRSGEASVSLPARRFPSALAARRPPYNVFVIGDSLADGVWSGLYRYLKGDRRFRVIKETRAATGLTREDYFDWVARVHEVAATHRIDAAIVMFGPNDRQAVYVGDERVAPGSAAWKAFYVARIRHLVDERRQSVAIDM